MSLRAVEARGADEIARLAPAWERLCARAPRASPFARPEWLLALHAAFEPPGAFFVTVLDGESVVALAPFFVLPRDGARVVLPLGASVSDALEPLAAPEHADAAARAIWAHLVASRARWDRLDFPGLAPDSPIALAAPAACRAWDDTPCMVLELPASREALGASMRPALAASVAKSQRRAARDGMRIEPASARDVPDALEMLRALHAARWRERGEPGVLADPRVARMHDRAAPALAARDLARLYVLRTPEARTAGVLYALLEPARMSFYAGGFDPALKRVSPGALLFARALDDAIALGMREADFLRGEEPYKADWGARPRPRKGLTLVAREL